MPRFLISALLVIGLPAAGAASAADWPAYRRDAARSAVTDERLTLPLRTVWEWTPPRPPAPAWPEPGRVLNVLDFDYAFQPVAAGGMVYFGSSSDDTVRALDAATGRLRWSFAAGGPVRFAPHIAAGRCHFASDDGFAYCLDAATGAEIWRVRVSATPRSVIANGRLSSRRPCRSGVLVRDGVVYVTAGMWPGEGVYVYALDAATGRELWCNDSTSHDYLAYPHEPSASFGGPAPQGYLLAGGDTLVVPTGRSCPAGFDARTGRLLYYHSELASRGGTWATIAGDALFFSAVGWQPDQSPRLGESPPHPGDSLSAVDLRTGEEKWRLGASMKETAEEWRRPRRRGQIAVGLMGRQHAVWAGDRLYAIGDGRVDAYDVLEGSRVRRAWSVAHPRVYAEALTAGALLLGGQDSLTALDPADGRVLWRTDVTGQVRGLAVSDGRVLAATDRGAILALAGAAGVGSPAAPAAPRPAAGEPLPPAVAAMLRQLPDRGAGEGFALVVGPPDARVAQALAGHTRLHVACVLPDEAAAAAERRRLVAETDLHGARVSVHAPYAAGGRSRLPMPAYFANLVVVSGDAAGLGRAELYRVLSPCGGVMGFLDGGGAAARILGEAAAPPAEARTLDGRPLLVRGKLPGAFDWDSPGEADERVRWPPEFQWFGEPGGELLVSRHSRPRTPLAAGGRLFVFGESHLTAVDAYNGSVLWRRRVSAEVGSRDTEVVGDDSCLYVRDRAAVYRLDARTGRLDRVFPAGAKRPAAPPVHDARKPLRLASAGKPAGSGAVGIEAAADGLRITLTAESPASSRDDAWELAFDFRPADRRLDAPGPGTFEMVLDPWTGVRRERRTFPHPLPEVSVSRAAGSASVTLTFAWGALERFAGRRPADFALSADLKLWTEDMRQRLWARPLTEGRERGLSESEAVVLVGEPPLPRGGDPARILSPHLPAPVGDAAELPAHARNPGRLPPLVRRRADGDFSADFREGLGKNAAEDPARREPPLRRARGYELPLREQPLTGATGPRDYTRSYGCSGTSTSAAMDFFRSGTIGMYDRLDDSGMRNIPGIRSGCGLSLVPAFGLLLYSESASDCTCAYSFATSLAMAPSQERPNEDWALFDDRRLTSGLIRRSALNLGAPGDRRDGDGTLWLGFPRPPLALARKTENALRLPYELEYAPGFGPYRFSTDRRAVAGSDRPWIYGSGVRGLTRLNLDLVHYNPRRLALSVGGAAAPRLDGELLDPCWDGFAAAVPGGGEGRTWLRHDADNLYIAFERKGSGRVRLGPRRTPVAGRDGDFEKDDHFRVSLRSRDGRRIVTLAATAGGGRYDGVLDLDVPVPATGGRGGPATLDLGGAAAVRLSWAPAGLQIAAEVPKDFGAGGASRLSLVFRRTDGTALEISLDPADAAVLTRTWNAAGAAPAPIPAAARAADGKVLLECRVPWTQLGCEGRAGAAADLCVRVGDPRDPLSGKAGAAVLSAARKLSSGRPDTAFRLRLSEADGRPGATVRTARNRLAAGVYELVPEARDDVGWNGEWTAAAARDDSGFRVEMAVPWKTLAAAGIDRDRLDVEFSRHGRWSGPQDRVLSAFAETALDVETLPGRPEPAAYAVRLHFAEPDGVPVGRRVFDVVINGRTVLKDFDVVREAGGPLRAVVREFPDVRADGRLEIRLVPGAGPSTADTVPVLSGVEVVRR